MLRYLVFICLLLVSLPQESRATSALTEPGQHFLEQQQRQQQQQRLEAPTTTITSPTLSPPPASDTTICTKVEKIRLVGSRLMNELQLEEITKPYVGNCLSMDAIRQLMHAVNNGFIELGYITTRVYIAPQDLTTGVLRLRVMEGFVEDIILNGNNEWHKRQVALAMPNLRGKILHLPDLEQGLEQLNRLQSNQAQLKLWPGERPGGTKIVITNVPQQTLRSYVSYDNFGQESTGKDRVRFSLEKDNLLGMNDTLAAYYITSLDTNAFVLSASLPYGYWTFGYDGSYSEFLSIISDEAELFGKSYNQTFRAGRLLHRSKRTTTALSLALNLKDSKRNINDIGLEPQSLTVARVGMSHTLRSQRSAWSFSANYSRGLSSLGALKDRSSLRNDAPHAQFDKIDVAASLYKPFSKATLRSSMRGQYSIDSLYGSEQISMGDNYTVRGFAGAEVIGDTGAYLRNELSMPMLTRLDHLLPPTWRGLIRPFFFADAGVVTYHAGETSLRYLAGMGGGLRFGKGRITGELTFGLPVAAHHSIDDDGFEIYLNTSVRLYPFKEQHPMMEQAL